MTPNLQGPSTHEVTGDFLPPNDRWPIIRQAGGAEHYASSTSVPTDWELGGVASNDSSRGMQYQEWKFELISSVVVATASITREVAVMHTIAGQEPDEITACFDGNMRPVVAYPQGGALKLYHYDSSIPGYRVSTFQGVSPRLTLDDARHNEIVLDNSDVLLFYARGSSCWYRQSRERFQVERFWHPLPDQFLRLGRVGRTVANRVQVEMLCNG